ncbi:hypothetical protein QJS10_CPB14g00259 [Acorus calamus]|uniref:Wall-associated receptor kinase galacturonan-binding domain-containing protein n=1 Tax=Acorus calamus TaxID=4465 RepID=A0AAV9DE62_ACOCL|nr:hypothetical protein QJS10_CPB14g00259 [Acorus calamus]
MRNQEFPLLALLLSLVFFISIPCLARNLKQLCHPSSCGDVRDIHHPFRLKGDPVGCGKTDFELSCVGNQTIFLLQNMPFYVKEINYTSGYLRIIDVELANGKCPFPHNHLTTLQIQQDERFCLDYDYINFIICSQVVGPENLFFGSKSENLFVPCASTSNEKAYVTNGYSTSELKSSCRHVASVPATTDSYNTSEYFSSLAGVQRLLANGFDFRWSGCNTSPSPINSTCVFQCLKNATRPPEDKPGRYSEVFGEFVAVSTPCDFLTTLIGQMGVDMVEQMKQELNIKVYSHKVVYTAIKQVKVILIEKYQDRSQDHQRNAVAQDILPWKIYNPNSVNH